MDENEKKDSLTEGEEPVSDSGADGTENTDNASDSSDTYTAPPQDNTYNYGGYNSSQDNRYNPYNYGYGGYQPQPSGRPAARSSSKLLVVLLSVISVFLVVAIVGIGILVNQILGQIEPNTPENTLPLASDIVDSEFDLTQSNTPGEKYASLADAYDATHAIFAEINTTSETDGTIGAGSGFLVARMKGNVGYYIVTNNHVVEGATKITVRLSSGKEYTAMDTVLRDERTDLAVIAIAETAELQVAKLGKSENIRVGEDVYVIGNPLGTLAGTLTNGIISAKDSPLYINNHVMTLLQTTAAINPGNSGGPIFNMSGEVIGIANAKYVGVEVEDIGFAIPMDLAINIVEQMVQKGYVQGRHDLGITTEHNLYGTGGLWISGIDEDSSLLKAGLPYNSMYAYQITAINGQTFDSSVRANQYLDSLEAGQSITISVNIYELTFTQLKPLEAKNYSFTLGQKYANK